MARRDGKNTAKVNKLCLKCAIKVSHKTARVLRFGLQRTESDVEKLENPEKKHTMCVCGHRQAGTGVRTAHVDRCKVVAVLNETPRVGVWRYSSIHS